MRQRWHLVLLPSLAFSFLLIVASQYIFLRGSFYADLRLGRLGNVLTLQNYQRIFSDTFYLSSLWLTVRLSALVVLFTLIMGYPVAYMIARMRSHWSMVLLALIVASSFVTIVIKVLGLVILFSTNGHFNRLMVAIGLFDAPYALLGSISGVVIGLMHFTMGFLVLLLYGVIQTIPRSLEEAAHILGASRWRVFFRIVIPLSLPGVIASALIVFNLSMGAFTSAALIGAGKVMTLPVLIQRTVILDTKYAMGATLSAVLLIAGVLINLLSIFLVSRLRATRQVTA